MNGCACGPCARRGGSPVVSVRALRGAHRRDRVRLPAPAELRRRSRSRGPPGADSHRCPFAAVFGAVIGVFTFGHEYRHGAIRATFTDLPRTAGTVFAGEADRPGRLGASWSPLVALVHRLVRGPPRLGILDHRPRIPAPSPTGTAADRVRPAHRVLWTLMGVALGGLLRSIPAAIVVIFVVPLVAEPVITVGLHPGPRPALRSTGCRSSCRSRPGAQMVVTDVGDRHRHRGA